MSFTSPFRTLLSRTACKTFTQRGWFQRKKIVSKTSLKLFFCIVFSRATYATQSSLKTALDKKSIQFTSKQLKQALEHKDVVFYEAPAGVGKRFMWLYVSAGVQLMFWYVCN